LRVKYSYDCSSFGGPGNFIADFRTANQDSLNSDSQSIASAVSPGGAATVTIYPRNAGSQYNLAVNSQCDWSITVTTSWSCDDHWPRRPRVIPFAGPEFAGMITRATGVPGIGRAPEWLHIPGLILLALSNLVVTVICGVRPPNPGPVGNTASPGPGNSA